MGHVQALESVLNNYRIRHAQCVSSTTLPNKYIVMSMADNYAGLGNQFPSVITGDRSTPPSLYNPSVGVAIIGCNKSMSVQLCQAASSGH